MRGYGESDKPKGVANYDVELLANEIAEFIEKTGKYIKKFNKIKLF